MKNPVKTIAAALAAVLCLGTASPAFAADYTVAKCDSLWKIARGQLGSGSRWVELYEANKESIMNPNLIYVGQVITIPGAETEKAAESEASASAPIGKVIINFEGVITNIDGEHVTLDSGKTLIVTEDTLFGAPDMGKEVSSELTVGNFVQGYTASDSDAEEIAATRIWINLVPEFAPGKFIINYEGRIAAIDGDRVTLDTGKTLILTDSTVYSIPQGIVESVILSEGMFIQGYTADAPESPEITAARLHVTPL